MENGSSLHTLQDMITEIAMKWSKIARTGAIEVKFMGVDVSTIMFTLEKGQDTLEVHSIQIQPIFCTIFCMGK